MKKETAHKLSNSVVVGRQKATIWQFHQFPPPLGHQKEP